jgi:hypothetical protein
METNYPISVSVDQKTYHFEVGEYLHQDGERCKFKVFKEGMLVASFEPDRHQLLHLCQNQGKVEEQILHLLADQIEARHPHGF